jgi:hypothetical protein
VEEESMSGLTWARNESDDHALSMKELSETFLKLKTQYQAQHNKPLKAVRLSRLTLLHIPLALPMRDASNPVSTFYGVPIEVDDSLALGEFKEVHA